MKFYRRPLSEEFVYSSPEKPAANSYRWVAVTSMTTRLPTQASREVRSDAKRRN